MTLRTASVVTVEYADGAVEEYHDVVVHEVACHRIGERPDGYKTMALTDAKLRGLGRTDDARG